MGQRHNQRNRDHAHQPGERRQGNGQSYVATRKRCEHIGSDAARDCGDEHDPKR